MKLKLARKLECEHIGPGTLKVVTQAGLEDGDLGKGDNLKE